MKCKICGAELGIDEKICHECGNPIEEQNPSGTEENNQGEENGQRLRQNRQKKQN